MQTFTIRRRNAWKSPEELDATAGRSTEVGEQMSDEVRWIRSYVLQDDDGSLGSLCVYEAISEDALRDHAQRVDMPADEITAVADTVVCGRIRVTT